MNMLLAASDPLSHVIQHDILAPELGGEWPFNAFTILSNQMVMMIAAFFLLLWLMPKAALSKRGEGETERLVPTGFGNAIEGICVLLREQVARPALGKHTDTFVPYIWSAFFFVLTCNLLGLLPLSGIFQPLGAFGVDYHWFGGTATGNIMVTAALAISTLFMIVYNGLRLHGMHYVQHFFIGPAYLAWFIAILEVIGLLAKTFALAMRLFANMVAGHILLAVLASFTMQSILAWEWVADCWSAFR
jgi:F-type H+-transporting ATPase subunit a